MRRILKAAALAALSMTTAVAASPERGSRTAESNTFERKTTTKKKYELQVSGDGTRVRMHVKVSVRAGIIMVAVGGYEFTFTQNDG